MAYQIKVTIAEIEPPIWRRLRIPGKISFEQLHWIIQAAFGWLGYHLYSFEFEKVVITEPDPDFAPGECFGKDVEELDATKTPISCFFDEEDRCMYTYDFGDCWHHEIVVEEKLKETRANSRPRCLAGARHRPPEDVGGVGGYAHFLEVIGNKDDPEREEMLEWARKDTRGRLFDPEYFYLEEINERLEHAHEDNPQSARRILRLPGLIGTLKFDGLGPYLEVRGKRYTWERIGRLLSMLDEDLTVNVSVLMGKRRRRY